MIEQFFSPNGWWLLLLGVGLLAIAIGILLFIKNLLLHVLAGGAAWVVVVLGLGVKLPFWPSLLISLLFGPAGTGTLLVLKFFGLLN
ncbi:MAG: hypothetical protein HY917_04340 [Candidatus Diapherotrites archaeon]|nr:hypothetical protein [Candidatus Diapherotrites archaeon]